MAFEPNNITKEHIQKAVARIKSENIDLVPSTRWNVLVDNEQFPPKDLMRLAHEEMNGERIWFNSGGYATNKYFEKMGYAIVEKDSLADPIKELIAKYKLDLQENKLADEIYKWKLVNQYKGRPDLTAPNFLEELKGVNYSNLIYGVGIAVIYHLAKDRTEPYRECFKVLFNESLPLAERLEFFYTETLKLYRELVPEDKYSHHQDERTMATFLAFRNPDKYPFYKDSFYQKYCKLIGVKARKKGEKYLHYLELLNEFISEYLEPDSELLDMVDNLLPEDVFKDTNRKILAQDILYRMLDKGLEEIEVGDASVYKISMGDFNDQEIADCIDQKKIIVHQDTKPLGQMRESQGLVYSTKMSIGDYFYLTPGNRNQAVSLLGRITGNAAPASFNNYGDDGWLERSFEIIATPKNKTKYTGKQKWWTPNRNSTCVAINHKELDEVNKLLMEPYFMAKLVSNNNTKDDALELEEDKSKTEFIENRMLLNQILFGPPGTGKTYNTINKALEILSINTDGIERAELKKIFEERVAAGQIMFTTFHQSMSYEDFIEGIKPIEPDKEGDPVIYRVVEGVFKRLCIEASFSLATKNESVETENVLDFSLAFDTFAQQLEERLATETIVELDIKHGGKVLVDSISPQGNILIKHHGGSRTYTVSKPRLSKLQKSISDLDEVNNINNHFRNIIGGNNSSAYWAVLNAIRKNASQIKSKPEERNYTWEEKIEVVQSLNHDDYKKNQGEPFVLIIDEINRGNVSQIFGELITLIEEDKRLGGKEQLEVILPYSKEKFGVPANLYIIGTMNTADRSVEALDTALRRRFSFVEMPPRYDLEGLQQEVEGYKLADILQKINRRIEKLQGKDNLIGHSYFLCVENTDDLRAAFQNKIIPLLQEYFYGDYGKIGLVLGEGFFEELEKVEEDDVFAKFGNYDPAGLAEKQVYHLAELIGTGRLSDDDFKAALDKLMK